MEKNSPTQFEEKEKKNQATPSNNSGTSQLTDARRYISTEEK